MTQGVSFYPTEREVWTCAYIRLSDDNDGTMNSPETQWRRIVALAQRNNVPVPPPERVFTDRDLSATDPNVIRLEYRRMLKAIEALDSKRYEVVVLSYAQDRVFRQPADWQHFAELVGRDNYDGRLITDYDGNVDLSSNGGFAVIASYGEAKKTARRSRDGLETAALQGKGHGQVGYGWERIYDHSGTGKPTYTTVIVESEAAVIRDAARRIVKGDSLRAICLDLNARGILSPGAGDVTKRNAQREPIAWAPNEWGSQKLRKLLLRKANVGIRQHLSGRGARQAYSEHKADWPAILDDDTYATMCARLLDPERRTVTSNAPKYLLSGIGTCGKDVDGKPCGLTIRGRVSYKGKARVHYAAYSPMCGHVVKSVESTERVVTSEVLHVLSQPEVRASLTGTPDDDTASALEHEAALLARKDAAADDYADGIIDRAMMARIAASVDAQLAEVRAILTATNDAPIYAELLSGDVDELEALWSSYDITYQRSIIKALFDVSLLPNPRSGRGAFDPTTIRIDLRPMRGE